MPFYGLESILKGKLGSYTLVREVAEQVWQAKSSLGGYVTVKTLASERLLRERNNLARFQTRTPHIRPFIDEIDPGKSSYALVLKHFDEELSEVIDHRRLAKRELKLVAKNVLEALRDLHADGWIHADLKPSNILINRPEEPDHAQITDAQLSDLEDAVPEDHSAPRSEKTVGTLPFVSPENLLKMPWSTPTDIWSFGATMMSLIHGHAFDIFQPHIWGTSDPSYSQRLLQRQNAYFGPFPASYAGIADARTMRYIAEIMQNKPVAFPETLHPETKRVVALSMDKHPVPKHYSLATTFPDICAVDREFILRIIKMDPRERPTAQELLQDVWFDQDEQSGSLEDEIDLGYSYGIKVEPGSCEDDD